MASGALARRVRYKARQSNTKLIKLYATLILLYPMLLSLDGLAATLFAPFRVKLLLLHAGEALHLSNGVPLSLVQTMSGEMDYQN